MSVLFPTINYLLLSILLSVLNCKPSNIIFNLVDGFDNAELRAEFEKVFTEWMAYYEASALDPFINANPKVYDK